MQPLKEETAVLHLFDDLKPLGDDSLPFPVGVEPLDGGGHFFLQARDALHMHALVEHINAEQQFQVIAIVCLEGCKFFACLRVAGIGLVDLDVFIYIREPLRHMGCHLVHVFLAGTEHGIFSTRLCDMLCENLVETVGLLQRAAEGFQVFLVGVLDAGAA